MMAAVEEDEEKRALWEELKWLLREEVHTALDRIGYTLKECSKCFPMTAKGSSTKLNGSKPRPGQGAKGESLEQGGVQRMLLSSATATTPGGLKCMVTLKGDSISEADIAFKHKEKGKDSQVYRTTILREREWKLYQVQDAANHLQEALQIVSLRQQDYTFSSAQEVLLLLEELKKNVQASQVSLSTPRRKSLQDLANSKTREIFSPPVPQNVALSFYIHGSKVVLAIYHLHMNGQQRMDVSQRIQMESSVQWLHNALAHFTLALQQCQQLADKIITVCQCAGFDHNICVTRPF